MRSEADNVARMLEAGFRPGEVAEYLGMTRQRVGEMQKRLRTAMVASLRTDGYTEIETIRYLGVPTAMVTAHLPPAA